MKKRIQVLVAGIALGVSLLGCSSKDQAVQEQTQFLDGHYDIEQVLVRSTEALEREDVDLYMASYYVEDIPALGLYREDVYDYIRDSALEVFAYSDLQYEILSMELQSIADGQAVVRADLRTWSEVDEDFEETVGTSEIILVQADDQWYISATHLFY